MASGKISPALTGKRRIIEASKAMRFPRHWPASASAQDDAIRDWFDIAAQIIHAERLSFRLLAAMPWRISRDSGEVWDSDEALAAVCGGCGKKTISREVSSYQAAGIIMIEHGWRDRAGKKVKTRKIRMSVPADMPGYVTIRDFRPPHS